MQDARIAAPAGINRRHLVTGALGAAALPLVTPAFGRGVEAPATAADEGFMRIALEEAALGDDPYFFGAVICAKARCRRGAQSVEPAAGPDRA